MVRKQCQVCGQLINGKGLTGIVASRFASKSTLLRPFNDRIGHRIPT